MRSGPRESLDPACPFCKAALERPTSMILSAGESAQGGTCKTCGAIYLVDPTGKSVGEVMSQALGMAAEKLSKDISQMVAGEDYEDAIVNYDIRTHRSTGISRGFMNRQGMLYVLKVKQKAG